MSLRKERRLLKQPIVEGDQSGQIIALAKAMQVISKAVPNAPSFRYPTRLRSVHCGHAPSANGAASCRLRITIGQLLARWARHLPARSKRSAMCQAEKRADNGRHGDNMIRTRPRLKTNPHQGGCQSPNKCPRNFSNAPSHKRSGLRSPPLASSTSRLAMIPLA